MSYALGQDKIIGVACLGITHPHTSGRLKAVQRMQKTVYSPELAEIGNPVYFDREAAAFFGSLRNGTASNIPATQAHNINLVLEAMFASSAQSGAEVMLTGARSKPELLRRL